MASLYQVSENSRKIFIGVLAVVLLILAWDTFSQFSSSVKLDNTNTTFSFYLDPDNALGASIVKPTFKSIPIDTSVAPTYSIDGIFGLFPNVAYVYQIDKPREKLTTIENAVETAKNLGFDSTCQNQQKPQSGDYCYYNGDNYEWASANGTKILQFNKTTQLWGLNTSFADNIEAKKPKTISLSVDTYAAPTKRLISALGFDNSYGLNTGLITTSYTDLGIDGVFIKPDQDKLAKYVFLDVFRQLRAADIKSSAQLSTVKDKSLIPNPFDSYVYGSDPAKGEFRILASNSLTDYSKDIFGFNFINFDYTQKSGNIVRGNYLIITPDEAWTKVQGGKGALTSLIPQNDNPYIPHNNLKVTKFVADASKTELGYYEAEDWNGYVYPIYIFKGRAELEDGRQSGFKIYVEAIKRLD